MPQKQTTIVSTCTFAIQHSMSRHNDHALCWQPTLRTLNTSLRPNQQWYRCLDGHDYKLNSLVDRQTHHWRRFRGDGQSHTQKTGTFRSTSHHHYRSFSKRCADGECHSKCLQSTMASWSWRCALLSSCLALLSCALVCSSGGPNQGVSASGGSSSVVPPTAMLAVNSPWTCTSTGIEL